MMSKSLHLDLDPVLRLEEVDEREELVHREDHAEVVEVRQDLA